MKNKLTHGEKTRLKILAAGCEIWKKSPEKVTISEIAKMLGMTHPAISYHYPDNLRDEVAKYAVKIADSFVIIQLIATNHPAVIGMSDKQRNVHIKAVRQPRLV